MSTAILLMLAVLLALILAGVPIAFAQACAVLLYVTLSGYPPIPILAQQTVAGIDSFVLLALPLFIWCGVLMERSGASEGLMRLVLYLIGRLPGGSAIASVVATTFFGALTGSAVASTAAIGQIMEPQLVRQGYRPGFVASLQAASGSLGAVMPPSIALVTYGAIAGASIKSLFAGAVVPGLLIAAMLCAYAYVVSRRRGYGLAKAELAQISLGEASKAALPALVMPLIILGGIFGGVFTATEASAVGAIYVLLIGVFYYRGLDLRGVVSTLVASGRSTASIMLIIATSSPLAWILSAEQVPQHFTTLVLSVSDNPILVMLMINVLLLVLGTFMETIAIIVILTPVLLPVVTTAGVDPVVFGVLMIVNLSLGAITPPLGVCAFVAAKIIAIDVRAMWPELIHVVLLMTLGLLLIILFPGLVSWVY
ncbi:TRAP transporter large permease [Salinisphaera sp. T31B1]|uniref:TRAP transporter large permease n=1 Tax=Salinisphaera sp. T31B1 TaxID=727963 RepID=UPI00333E6149